MNPLLVEFLDNGRGHDDLHIWIEGYSRTMDSYYLALDETIRPSDKSADKVRRVLAELLRRWISAVERSTPSQPAFLPYDFSDECTGCFLCRPLGEFLDLAPGTSDREGWSVSPSDPGDYFFTITDFKPATQDPIRLTRTEFVQRVQRSIAAAVG